jgi:thiol-disulfide isomerase/thioredoxin
MLSYKRGTGKNNASYALRELYKEYKSMSDNPVEYKVYAELLKEYNDRIIKAIIYDNLEYKMPYRLGYLRLQKLKKIPFFKDGKLIKKHISPDWKRTKEFWEKEYPGLTTEELDLIPDKKVLIHHNDHTDGYSARWYWDKRFSNVKNQSCYIFKATRTAKETLAAFIKKIGLIEYFE